MSWIYSLKREVKRRFCSVNPSPVIVLGNQKAGTSAIAHLTAEYAGLSKTIDIPESWWPTLESLLKEDLSLKEFAHRNPHRFCTDIVKEPNLTFFYSDIEDIHPKAHFVFVVRDPRSNIRSLLDRLDLPGDKRKLGDALENLPHEWRHLFRKDIWGLQGSSYIDLLAARWRKAAHVYLGDSSSMNLIRFESFLSDKSGAISSLAEDIGLQQQHDISEKVDIQYQPRGNRDVSWLEFFGAENIRRIEDICYQEMSAFGYNKVGEI